MLISEEIPLALPIYLNMSKEAEGIVQALLLYIVNAL